MNRLIRVALALALLGGLTGCLKTDPSALPTPCGVDEDGNPVFQAGGGDPCDPPPPQPPCEDCAGISGEPHVWTFDDRAYDLQAVGEFTAARTDEMLVQVRLAPYPNSRRVSVVAGVAAQVGDQRITVQMEDGRDDVVRIDGEMVTLSATEGTPVGGGRAGLDDLGRVTVEWADGARISVRPGNILLDLLVDVLDAPTEGILGDNDGDPDDDLTAATGEVLGDDPSHEDLYDVFAESWRITDETSLFDYADGTDTETFTDRSFPDEPITLDDLSEDERTAAEEICRAAGVTDPAILDACILDVAVTGDPSFAASAADMQVALDRGPLEPSGAAADDDATTIDPSDAVAWITRIDGLADSRGPDLVTDGSRIFVQGRDTTTGERTVIALDATTGEELWRHDGITASCSVAVTDAGTVIGAAYRGGPLAVDDEETAVAFDAATGEIVGQTPLPEGEWEFVTHCAANIVADDDLVVMSGDQMITAWRLDDDGIPSFAWQIRDEAPLLDGAAMVDGHVMVGTRGDPEPVEILAIDGDGTIVDRLDVAGKRLLGRSTLVGTGDGVVVSTTDDRDDEAIAGTVSMVELDAGSLSLRWEHDISADADDGPTVEAASFTVSDDLAVGHAGPWLLAIELATGDVAWQVQPPGFRNTNAPAGYGDGRFYDGQFGGPFVVAIDEQDGQVVEEFMDEDLFGSDSGIGAASMFGLVVDDRLITVAGSDGSRTVIALDVGS